MDFTVMLEREDFLNAMTALKENPDLASQKLRNERYALHNFCLSKSALAFDCVTEVLKLNERAVFERDIDGYLPLHMAAQAGISEVFQHVYSRNMDAIYQPALNGRTVLHFAAQEGHSNIVKFILELWPNGAQITSDDGRLPVHLAAFSGSVKCINMLLQFNPSSVMLKSADGQYSPLFIASGYGHVEATKLIFHCFPDAAVERDIYGRTPLEISILKQKVEVASFFMDNYPECMRAINPVSGRSTWHHACFAVDNASVIDKLITGAREYACYRDTDGYLPIHIASQSGNLYAVKSLTMLCPHGFLAKANNGRIPLHFAAQSGHLELVEYIISFEPASVMVRSYDDQFSPLHLASYNGFSNVVEALLETNIMSSKLTNHVGWLPLHSMICGNNPFQERTLRQLLRAHPAGASTKNAAGETPFQLLVARIRMVASENSLASASTTESTGAVAIPAESLHCTLLRLFLAADPRMDEEAYKRLNWMLRRPALLASYPQFQNKAISHNAVEIRCCVCEPPDSGICVCGCANFSSAVSATKQNILAVLRTEANDLWRQVILFL